MGDYSISWRLNVKASGIASIANGIIARHFYASFGKDAISTIGNDTLVNPIDLLSVAYSTIKALKREPKKLRVLKKKMRNLKLI